MEQASERRPRRRRTYSARLGYIGLDQARLLAIEHARDHTDFYGPSYAGVNLAWEVLSAEESEDYYDIRLSFRPAGRYRGEPGAEQIIFDKMGELRVRQMLDEPSELGASDARIKDLNKPANATTYCERAIGQYDKAIRDDSRNALAYTNRGNAYARLGQFERAIHDADEAIRLDRKFVNAYILRGGAYGMLGEFQQAIKDMDKALRFKRNDATTYYARGAAYAQLERPHRAIRDLNEAIRLMRNRRVSASRHIRASYHRRGIPYGHDDFEPLDMDKAQRLGFAMAYYQRGAAYADLGQFQRAIKDFDEAVRYDPRDGEAFACRAAVNAMLGKEADAQRDNHRAINLGIEPETLKLHLDELKNQRPNEEEEVQGHAEVARKWWRAFCNRINLAVRICLTGLVSRFIHLTLLWIRRIVSVSLCLWGALILTGSIISWTVNPLWGFLVTVAGVMGIVSGVLLWRWPHVGIFYRHIGRRRS